MNNDKCRRLIENGSMRYVLETVPKLLHNASISLKSSVAEVLLDRIRSEVESEDAINQLLRMMGLYLHSDEAITEALVELLYASPYRVVLIHHIPQLTYQSPKCIALVLQAYKELLESDGALLVPLLGSLVDMPLTPAQQNEIVYMAHTIIDSVDEADVPSTVKSLLAMLTPSNGNATLGIIRKQSEKLSVANLHLVLDIMSQLLYSGSLVLKFTIRAIRSSDELIAIDGLWLLILIQRASEHSTIWKCLLFMHKKITLEWLNAIHNIVVQPEWHLYQANFVQFCALLIEVAFHKSTTIAIGTTLISHAVQTLTKQLQTNTDPQAVLLLLLGIVSQSHKWTGHASKLEGLRWHMAKTAAIGLADSIPSLEPFGHVLLDTIHVLSNQKATENLLLLDPLCFSIVQLVRSDASLYGLLLITIQKHILLPQSSLQLTAILLASHLKFAQVLEPTDLQTISTWMIRLLSYAPLSVVSAVCIFLSAYANPELAEKHIIPALRRRGVISSNFQFSVDDYVQQHYTKNGDADVLFQALSEFVRCLVSYASPELLKQFLDQPLLLSWPEEFGATSATQDSLSVNFQCGILVCISLCNALFQRDNTDPRILELFQQAYTYYDQHKNTSHGKKSLSFMMLIEKEVLCSLLPQADSNVQARVIHILYNQLYDNTCSTTSSHWRLYGTHASARLSPCLQVPWKTIITEFAAKLSDLEFANEFAQAKGIAETLIQILATLISLMTESRDEVVAALAENLDCWQASDDVYQYFKAFILQLKDAQVLSFALELVVLLCKDAPLMLQDVAMLSKSLLSTVYPYAHMEMPIWKAYMANQLCPRAAQWLTGSTFLKAYYPHHSTPEMFYIHHCLITWYALSPKPLPMLASMIELLTTMVTDEMEISTTLRTCTRASFPQYFTSFWLCVLSMVSHPSLSPVKDSEAPYAPIQTYLQIVEKGIALANMADIYSAELARKTVPLLVRACQFLCERLLVVVDKCLLWRLERPGRDGDVTLLSPIGHHVQLVLEAMDRYVQYIQTLMVLHMKTVMQHTKEKSKSKLAQLTKGKKQGWTMLHRIPQVKQLPQLQRWIHRAKASLRATQTQNNIPLIEDNSENSLAPFDTSELNVRSHDVAYRWQKKRKSEHVAWASSDEEAKDDEDIWSSENDSDDGFQAKRVSKSLRSDIQSLQTPMKLKLIPNEEFGFQSIVIDFKTKQTTNL
ncbi:hypothetical protein THRCLA_06108 [Thraustotheca clavata]|uniref:Uncharacterized protein n=1 Tax=Thraustotheca clavata TaxID=74557 RepID=A0A1V9ZQI7_9STRA|nr:hypothetical protein THRCLA_06108 [Thraustotheca clavata]